MPSTLSLGRALHIVLLDLSGAALVFTLQMQVCLASLEGSGGGGGTGTSSILASGLAPAVLPTGFEHIYIATRHGVLQTGLSPFSFSYIPTWTGAM
jgi:hypothetical protein